jgi:plastocyanin
MAAGMLAVEAAAGPEKIAFPAGFERWEMYTSLDRPDLKQHRELYAKPEVVKAVREGRPIPYGAVLVQAAYAVKLDEKGTPVKDANGRFIKEKLAAITVMEKRQGWGAEYPAQKRNGEWEYAAFTPEGKPNEKANAGIDACFNCHKPHEKQDYVISLARLAGTFPTGPVATRSGPTDVNITSFSFGPSTIRIAPGQTVTWTNADELPHQISVVGKPMKTAVLLRGQSASLKFDEAGTFGYVCALHPNLKGTVEVTK